MHPPELQNAHDHAFRNRDEVEQSSTARCFFCLASFTPAEIKTWVPESGGGETAVCPQCSIDSVIGSASGVDMSDGFFEEMSRYWFESAART